MVSPSSSAKKGFLSKFFFSKPVLKTRAPSKTSGPVRRASTRKTRAPSIDHKYMSTAHMLKSYGKSRGKRVTLVLKIRTFEAFGGISCVCLTVTLIHVRVEAKGFRGVCDQISNIIEC